MKPRETIRQTIVRCTKALDATCQHFGTKREPVTGRGLEAKPTLARHVFMYVARTELKVSLPTIGMVVDRDHTSVLSGVRRIARMIDEGHEIAADVRAIVDRLHGGLTL